MTSRNEIAEWYDLAVQSRATHMLVVVDEFDHEDYPVFVRVDLDGEEGQDGRVIVTKNIHTLIESRFDHTNSQRLMECYNLAMDKHEQLGEFRAKNF